MYLDQYEDEWNRRLTAILKDRLQAADRRQRLQLIKDIEEMQALHHISKRQARELLALAENPIQIQKPAGVVATTSALDDPNRTYKQLLLF